MIDISDNDVTVIGAGPGGYVAAIRAAQLGRKVTLIEKENVGGECLNWGCIPSKSLIAASNLLGKLDDADKMGISIEGIKVDIQKLQAWKGSVVEKLISGIRALCRNYGIDLIYGTAKITSDQEVEIIENQGGKRVVTSTSIIVASGSHPLPVEGLSTNGTNIITSKEALELNEIPKKLVVVGGGAIGLELGTMYRKLGSTVTVIEISGSLLPGVEPDLVRVISRSLQKLGIETRLNSKVSGTELSDGGMILSIANGNKVLRMTADKVLVAVGRGANTNGLGLDSIGVEMDSGGFIKVDEHLRTNVGGVFAIGDAIGPPYLAHKAQSQAIIAAECSAGMNKKFDFNNIPSAIFTTPEIGSVGLTEKLAIDQGYDVSVGKFQFGANGRALTAREKDGLVKVIIDKKTSLILGVHIAGPDASNLISEASLALRLKAKVEDIESTIHPHPTLSEAFAEAVSATVGRSIHSIVKRQQ